MTYDPAKSMTVTYNHLNLPIEFDFGSNDRIEIVYDASGQKLQKKVYDNNVLTTTKDYVFGWEYTNGKLEAIYNAEGRNYNTNVNNSSSTIAMRYEYNITDHLGNVRLSYTDKDNDGVIEQASGEVLTETHYYPFGMNMDGPWIADATEENNQYLYNGKELNTDFGLDMLDYGFRWYDSAIARWHNVDPRAEKYFDNNPYNYVLNNPIINIDPRGDTTQVYNEAGVFQYKIYDSHPNQDHFLGDDELKFLGMITADSDVDAKGNVARGISSYFAGETTRAQIQEQSAISDKEGLERAYVLMPGSDGELQVNDITHLAEYRTANEIDVPGALIKYDGPTPIGWGHTHPKGQGGDNDEASVSMARSLDDMADYQGFITNKGTGKIGGNPAFLGSYKGLTIYSTGVRTSGKKHSYDHARNTGDMRVTYSGSAKYNKYE